MTKRKIIKIDETKCNGCGLCMPNCPEGAIQIIDRKARLISDLFCDGLGACIGHCPQGAINIEEREAQDYSEIRVMGNIIKLGENTIKAHLIHLKEHGKEQYLREAVDFLREKNIRVPAMEKEHQHHGCLGSKVINFKDSDKVNPESKLTGRPASELSQWPVQIMLVPVKAPYLKDADLLVAADCVPFAYGEFHRDLLKDKALLVGCPKLDNIEVYADKFKEIFQINNIKSVTYVHMEVPCCFGLVGIIKEAIGNSGKNIPFKETVISIRGEKIT